MHRKKGLPLATKAAKRNWIFLLFHVPFLYVINENDPYLDSCLLPDDVFSCLFIFGIYRGKIKEEEQELKRNFSSLKACRQVKRRLKKKQREKYSSLKICNQLLRRVEQNLQMACNIFSC